jgi:hypothetical protein
MRCLSLREVIAASIVIVRHRSQKGELVVARRWEIDVFFMKKGMYKFATFRSMQILNNLIVKYSILFLLAPPAHWTQLQILGCTTYVICAEGVARPRGCHRCRCW